MNDPLNQSPVALVTGAGSGIGSASAIALAEAGFRLGVLGHTSKENKSTLDDISSVGGEGIELLADVRDEREMRDAVDKLITAYGRLDVVVVNAGINGVWAPIDDLTPDEWDKTIAVNLRGTYLTLHLTVPHLKEAGAGSIIVISSINGTRTFTTPGATAYTATKAAQLAIVQQLALELGKHRIRVNAICPGAIETQISDNTQSRDAEETKVPVVWPEGEIPLTGGEPGASRDVADVVVFLASDKSRHITGSPVWVDGGQGLLR